MSAARLAAIALLGAAVLLIGCSRSAGDRTFVLVTASLEYRAVEGRVALLRAELADDAGRMDAHEYTAPGGGSVTFPATFTMELPRDAGGPFALVLTALDAERNALAGGRVGSLVPTRGATKEVDVWLDCLSGCGADAAPPARDAGAGRPGDGGSGELERCGNGRLDPGETCDTAIGPDRLGACPPASCDDAIPCTRGRRVGEACSARCVFEEVREFAGGDGCCPADGTAAADADCSATCGNGKLEAGEACDPSIPTGRTGACPRAADCIDTDPCTEEALVSAGSCGARCVHRAVTASVAGDRCCPAGATNGSDPDCPIVCGNGFVEIGEACDTGVAAGAAGSCPASCDDGQPCTVDTLEGVGCAATCRSRPMAEFTSGDRCCPPGGNRLVDADCPATCGNGIVEPGESCDRALPQGQPGACPSACPSDPTGCLPATLEGTFDRCTARCVWRPVTTCSAAKDACCPSGCASSTDPDCSPSCGNGVREPEEACDTAIPEGAPGACPRSCADGDSCTADVLVSAGTCSARCVAPRITQPAAGDRCCPPGANQVVDPDCPATCGNSVVEAKETCDRSVPAGAPGACAASCPAPLACTSIALVGEPATCSARCSVQPVTACQGGDGCCPAGCTRQNDGDCPAICGNGVLEPGEACDKAITAGHPGACSVDCTDGDACTIDVAAGRVEDCSRVCTRSEIRACAAGDRCCPEGCGEADRDCTARCGNGLVEKGETCDPPGTCPTLCADDGDRCTAERLVGDPRACTALCAHPPIVACSPTTPDGCCPSGCTSRTDADCGAAPATSTR